MVIAVRAQPRAVGVSPRTFKVAGLPSAGVSAGAAPVALTMRECEVLSLVAEGYSNKAIAGQLGISERTVKSHLTYIMAKLRVSDRTHAVVTAVRLGWIRI